MTVSVAGIPVSLEAIEDESQKTVAIFGNLPRGERDQFISLMCGTHGFHLRTNDPNDRRVVDCTIGHESYKPTKRCAEIAAHYGVTTDHVAVVLGRNLADPVDLVMALGRVPSALLNLMNGYGIRCFFAENVDAFNTRVLTSIIEGINGKS